MDVFHALTYQHHMARTNEQIDLRGRQHRRAVSESESGKIATIETAKSSNKREQKIAVFAISALLVSSILGTYAGLGFIVAALALIALQPLESARQVLRFSPLLLLPLMALASTGWSDAPQLTSRAALELLITIVAAIIVCNRLSARALILTIFSGMLAICLIALAYVPASLSAGAPLAGPFETKNPMGFTAQMLMALSIVVMTDRRQPNIARLAAIPSIPIAAILIMLSNSGNALAGTVIMLWSISAFLLVGRLNIYMRIGLLLFTLAIIGVALAFLPEIFAQIDDFRQTVLKKDATLTGRTYLWDFAAHLIDERPLLGHGYYAFWRRGNIDAEGLWRWGGIASRSGFNFHNAFVEMQVDLGWIGGAIFIATSAGIGALGVYRLITRPSPPVAFFLSFVLAIYIRSYTESGLISPFSLVTLVWIGTAVYALAPHDDLEVMRPARVKSLKTRRFRTVEPRASAF